MEAPLIPPLCLVSSVISIFYFLFMLEIEKRTAVQVSSFEHIGA